MSSSINYLAGFQFGIADIAGSGLGFYGAGGFGTSVAVGQYQDNTYITDSTGAINGPKANNVKWVHAMSGMLPTNDVHLLQDIPNYLGSLNVRFTNSVACRVTSGTMYVYDRVNINNPASGVTVKIAQLVHPWNTTTPTGPIGSGDTAWLSPGGSGGVINGRTYDNPITMITSPGASGWRPSGVNTVDTQHDWYFAISCSPDTIGSKTQMGLYCDLDYV